VSNINVALGIGAKFNKIINGQIYIFDHPTFVLLELSLSTNKAAVGGRKVSD